MIMNDEALISRIKRAPQDKFFRERAEDAKKMDTSTFRISTTFVTKSSTTITITNCEGIQESRRHYKSSREPSSGQKFVATSPDTSRGVMHAQEQRSLEENLLDSSSPYR
jgi:hypothetical protein